MGDLWPPSVLVRPGGGLVLIDWEMCTRGQRCQDVGHLAAHLWLGAVASNTQGQHNGFHSSRDTFLVGSIIDHDIVIRLRQWLGVMTCFKHHSFDKKFVKEEKKLAVYRKHKIVADV